MGERKGVITFKGEPLTLVGQDVQAGDAAPDFAAVGPDLKPVHLSDFQGKVVVLSSVPSLDTSVCDTETRRLNQDMGALGDDVRLVTISMDLPFAQRRWCGAAGADFVKPASDHYNASFGESYGVLIKELRLLARAVFVVDRKGVVRYKQIVEEMTDEPDYGPLQQAVKKALA